MGNDVGGMVLGYTVVGYCVRLCVFEGDGVGAMPWGMMMLGDGVGLGNGGMAWGPADKGHPLSLRCTQRRLQIKATPFWGLL